MQRTMKALCNAIIRIKNNNSNLIWGPQTMKMTVSPSEIADHLTKELGHKQALEMVSYHLNRSIDKKTRAVWSEIGQVIDEKKPQTGLLQ